MPNTFTITTTATDTLKTDAKGHAEAVFTVTNTTARPVRGMARVRASQSTKPEWLQITGDTERDFPPGGTQQFVVTFDAPIPSAPPAGAATPAAAPAAEQYGFRLDVASAMNPDEDFTESPVVKVQLPAPEEVKPAKPFPKWIFIPIAVVLLLIIGIVLWLVLRDRGPELYKLPDVATLAESEAKVSLETSCEKEKECVVVTVNPIADNAVAKGMAIRTEPIAGTEVVLGSNVTLFVSAGPEATPTPTPEPQPIETYKLPAVTDQPEAAATVTLEGKCKTLDPCVEVEINRVSDNKVANGKVIRIEPKEGTEVNVGAKVTMFVSKGPDKVTIISVAKLPADTARDKLESSCGSTDCLDVEVNVVADNSVAKGLVIRTDPLPGIVVPVGSKVKLFVSGGADEVMIPSVRNRTVVDAKSLLESVCNPFPCLKVVQTSQSHDLIPSGRALGTKPIAGMVKIGSNVVLIVSTGPEPRLVGKYIGLKEAQARQRIIADGFTVGTVKRIVIDVRNAPPAAVVSQDPVPGIKRPKGAKINFVVMGRF